MVPLAVTVLARCDLQAPTRVTVVLRELIIPTVRTRLSHLAV